MRLKQLLGTALVALAMSAAAHAETQLTDIRVQGQGQGTTLAIQASAGFTHNEYRPADNLLIVDLSGVAAGKLENQSKSLNSAGVSGYKVSEYRSPSGTQTARLEVELTPHAVVHLQDDAVTHALMVRVTDASLSATPENMTAQEAPAAKMVPAKMTAAPSGAVHATPAAIVQGVSVVRGRNGLEIEVRANRPVMATSMKLREPDRIVIDVANAHPIRRKQEIPVHNGTVNEVRMAWYQQDPPVTRIVIDLASAQDFEVANNGAKLAVKLHAPAATPVPATAASTPVVSASNTTPEKPHPPAPASVAAVMQPVQTPTEAQKTSATPQANAQPQGVITAKVTHQADEVKPPVIVPTQYHEVTPAQQHEDDAAERAAEAAKSFGAAPPVEIPLASTPASASLRQPAMTVAALQQAAMQQSGAQTQPQPVSPPISHPTQCVTGKYNGEPISVNLKDVDLKDFFRLIHEISGLNVVLDPGVTGNLTLVLDDVPWDQALSIVLNNNGLECQLDGNVLRIALPATIKREADNRRASQEAQAMAVDRITVTRYLSYATAKDVAGTLKQFLSSRGDIIAEDRTNALIIQDIPSVIPNIDRLIQQIDLKTPQVEIEARVVAATRSFSRDLGTQVGFAYGNGKSTAIGGVTGAGNSPTQVGSGITGSGGGSGATPSFPYITSGQGQIPLFSNQGASDVTGGLTFLNLGSNYRLDVILTAAERRGLLKVLSRPRITTQNNKSSLIKQGVRIPVVTGAQLGGPPTTTYVDAFLRLQVKPQITTEGTIFMDIDVENTTPDFGRQVQGNPTLVQQQATTQVLVSDGQTAVIGGVIQTQDNVAVQQLPFIGNIPVFGNLFKRRAISTSTQELIFFITPKIVQT